METFGLRNAVFQVYQRGSDPKWDFHSPSGKLLPLYSQNINTLERGISDDRLRYVHRTERLHPQSQFSSPL
jgi:hypothetical protein